VENKGLKIIGTAVVVAGLMTGAFFAGGVATGGKSGAEPEIVPTLTAAQPAEAENDEDSGIVLVGDNDEPSEDVVDEPEQPETPQQPQAPVAPTTTPVEPTPAPPVVEPTPAPPAPEPTPVNEAPFVVSIGPADGEDGIEVDANIVVTFSEAMDKAAAQAAFNLSTGNCGAFSWNGDATVMTFDPCASWAYGTEVEVEVYDSAEDEDGLAMADDFDSEFMVLRQTTTKIWSDDAYDGHVYAPGAFVLGDKSVVDGGIIRVGTWSRGFLSFDLDELPEDLVDIQSATVNIKQKSHQAGAYTNATGWLMLDSVYYNTLTNGDWGLAANSIPCWICVVPYLSTDGTDTWKQIEMAGYVRVDWENRDDQDYLSQFRLRFANDCNGNCPSVSADFYSGKGAGVVRPYLYVTYTHP